MATFRQLAATLAVLCISLASVHADVDLCNSSPCLNDGTCQSGSGSVVCICPAGFTGPICETDINECLSSPCANGGTCDQGAMPNYYECICPALVSGSNCEILITGCTSSPCMNDAFCNAVVGTLDFSCQCASGYIGNLCQSTIDHCANSPCQNDGTCTSDLDGFHCACPAGFSGPQCTDFVDQCVSSPCPLGNTCWNQGSTYVCVAPCSTSCQNGGTCSGSTCYCNPLYTGATCETLINPTPEFCNTNLVGSSLNGVAPQTVPTWFGTGVAYNFSGDAYRLGYSPNLPLLTNGYTLSFYIFNQQTSPITGWVYSKSDSAAKDGLKRAGIFFQSTTTSSGPGQSVVVPVPGTNLLAAVNYWTYLIAKFPKGVWSQVTLRYSAGNAPQLSINGVPQTPTAARDLTKVTFNNASVGSDFTLVGGRYNNPNNSPAIASPPILTWILTSALVQSLTLCDVNAGPAADPCAFASSVCINGGLCSSVAESFSYVCVCPEGFTGSRCETAITVCTNFECSNGGSCVVSKLDNSHQCVCMDGFTGLHCETQIVVPCNTDIIASGTPSSSAAVIASGLRPGGTEAGVTLGSAAFVKVPLAAFATTPNQDGYNIVGWFQFGSVLNATTGGTVLVKQVDIRTVYETATPVRRTIGLYVRSNPTPTGFLVSVTLRLNSAGSAIYKNFDFTNVTGDISSGWHHLAATVTSDSNSTTVSLFVDGVFWNSITHSGANLYNPSAADLANQLILVGARAMNVSNSDNSIVYERFFQGKLQAVGVCAVSAGVTGCSLADSPCINGATCVSSSASAAWSCTCPTGFAGTRCEINAAEYCNQAPFTINSGVITCDCTGTIFGGARCNLPTSDPLSYPIIPNSLDASTGKPVAGPSGKLDTIHLLGGHINIPQSAMNDNNLLSSGFVLGTYFVRNDMNDGWVFAVFNQINPSTIIRKLGLFLYPTAAAGPSSVNSTFILQYQSITDVADSGSPSGYSPNASMKSTYPIFPRSLAYDVAPANPADITTHVAIAFSPVPGSPDLVDFQIYLNGVPQLTSNNRHNMIRDLLPSDFWTIATRPTPLQPEAYTFTNAYYRGLRYVAQSNPTQAGDLCTVLGVTSGCTSSFTGGYTLV